MKKVIVALLVFPAVCLAAQVDTAVVAESKCVMVQKEDTTVGTVVGGVLGGAVGSGLGSALFGKSGSLVGGLLGAGAGGVVGSQGDELYDCTIVTDSGEVISSVTDRSYSKGSSIKYVTHRGGTQTILD